LPDKIVYLTKNQIAYFNCKRQFFLTEHIQFEVKINYLMQVVYQLYSKNAIPLKQIYPAFSSQITQKW